MKKAFAIPFELGVSSASMQIEGGELDSNWHEWFRRGHIKDGTSPANANDHWNRYEEDFSLMEEMGIKHYRMSLAWSRIEPQEGEFNPEAIAHYRAMFESMKKHGIKPLVTLWHFSHPTWFEHKGGFLEEKNLAYFERFVSHVLEELGDCADEWVSINEPNVFATSSYLFGEFPPSEHNGMKFALKVMAVFALAHIRAYEIIKAYNPAYKVGFAHHVRRFVAKKFWDKPAAKLQAYLFQGILTKAFLRGHFAWPLKNLGKVKKGTYADFIGVNYYSHSVVSGFKAGFATEHSKNDLGWDIVPEDLPLLLEELYKELKAPIYITENGTCDNADAFRARYLYEHLKALSAVNLPLERYYQWSFSDNFEWCEGESARFGLVHIDYKTQERSIKDSGRFYADMIKNRGVSEEAYEQFVAHQNYHN